MAKQTRDKATANPDEQEIDPIEPIEVEPEAELVDVTPAEPIVLDTPVEKKDFLDMNPEDLGTAPPPPAEKKVGLDKKAPKEINTNDPDCSCRVIKKHSCHIGGKFYELTADRDVVLPSSVATILSQAGVLIKK